MIATRLLGSRGSSCGARRVEKDGPNKIKDGPNKIMIWRDPEPQRGYLRTLYSNRRTAHLRRPLPLPRIANSIETTSQRVLRRHGPENNRNGKYPQYSLRTQNF